jgi:hypothetical protein
VARLSFFSRADAASARSLATLLRSLASSAMTLTSSPRIELPLGSALRALRVDLSPFKFTVLLPLPIGGSPLPASPLIKGLRTTNRGFAERPRRVLARCADGVWGPPQGPTPLRWHIQRKGPGPRAWENLSTEPTRPYRGAFLVRMLGSDISSRNHRFHSSLRTCCRTMVAGLLTLIHTRHGPDPPSTQEESNPA